MLSMLYAVCCPTEPKTSHKYERNLYIRLRCRQPQRHSRAQIVADVNLMFCRIWLMERATTRLTRSSLPTLATLRSAIHALSL